MGLLMNLGATDNFIGYDFENAYWSIDNIVTSNTDGISHVSFEFNAYASREAKLLANTPVPNTGMVYGSSRRYAYEPILHTWEATFRAELIFPNGIPLSESDQKDMLYSFVKSYLNLTDYTDVYE